MKQSCPYCRTASFHRRKRTTLVLYFKSLIGLWPYRCDGCGRDIMLNGRHMKRLAEAGERHSAQQSTLNC